MNDELQNPLYRNWVKATLGLRQLQLGLAPYVDRLAREQHAVLLGTLQHAAPLHRHISPCPIQHNNDGCSANPIRHSTEESKTCQSCKFDICRTCGLSCCQSCGHLDLPTEISTNCTSCDLKTCKDCIKIICTTCFSGLNVLHCMTVDQGQTLEKNFVHDTPCVFASCISCKETYCTKCYVCQLAFCNCLTESIWPSHNSKARINKAEKQSNCKKEIAANCVKDACGGIYDKIVNEHRDHDPIWVNTDPRYWRTSYWEVAKCFLSSGGYSKRQSAKETDASGLLSVCINSNFIYKHLRNASNFSKARAIRNDVFHSCDSKLSDGDLQQHLDCILAVLKDTQEIESTSQTSIDCIIKLKSDTFEIRHVDSDYAKNERIKQLSDKQSKMEEEIADLRRDVDNATRDRKKLREDIERLKSLLTHQEADDVTGTGEVTIDVENVTPDEEEIISDDIVNVVGDIAQGRKVDTNDVVARATMNGYEKLHKENKRVTEAKSECIHLTIECTTLKALVSLFEDCLTDNMTSILEPLERAIQEKYRLPKLRLVARMSAEDIRASMKDVVSKLNKKAKRDKKVPTPPTPTGMKSLQAGTSIEDGSMKISSVHCNHTDLTTSLRQHTGRRIIIDDVVCAADKACGCTKTPRLYVPSKTVTLECTDLSVRNERESLMHINSLSENARLTMKDTNYLLEPVGISNLIRIVNVSKLRRITMENIKFTHTDMNKLLSSFNKDNVVIKSVQCVADKHCGCLIDPTKHCKDLLITKPNKTISSLSLQHEGDILNHLQLSEAGSIYLSDTDYINSSARLEYVKPLLNNTGNTSLYITGIKCTHTDMKVFLSSVKVSTLSIDSLDCVPDDRCGYLLESKDTLITHPNTTITYLRLKHEGDILNRIQFNEVKDISLSDTDYINSSARLEYVKPLLNNTGNTSLYITGIKCTHTDMKVFLSSVKVSTLSIDSLDCVPDNRCGYLLESKDTLITHPNTTISYLKLKHEGDILNHLQLSEAGSIYLSDTDYINSSARLEYVKPLLSNTGNTSLYITGIKCTHTDMKVFLSSVKVSTLSIDSLDCVPDNRCVCLKTESRTDSATVGSSTMTGGYSSSHEHSGLLSETSGRHGHVSEFHADLMVLRNNSYLPPHTVGKCVREINFCGGHYDTTNEHAIFDAIERCGAKSVHLHGVRISSDVAWNVIKYLSKMNQYHDLAFRNVSFPRETDVEIFTEVIEQLPGRRYDHWMTATRSYTDGILHCRIPLRGLGQNLPSWEDAKALQEEGRLKTFLRTNSEKERSTVLDAAKAKELSHRK